MLKSEAAAYLAGVTQTEGAEASAPTNLHVITGEVGEASADGKTLVKIDGLMFSESDDQFIEVDALGGLEEGDIATIVLTGEQGHAMTPLALGSIGSVDRITVRITAIEADYVKASTLEADVADIGFLKADSATITNLQADTAKIHNLTADQLSAATAYIADLTASSITAESLTADVAKVHNLTAQQLSAAAGYIAQLNADSVTAQAIVAMYGDFDTVKANAAKVANLTADELEADHAIIGSLSTNYAHITNGVIDNAKIGYADVNNLSAHYAEIQNGKINSALIDTAAIVDEQVFTVTGNKATLAQIDASKINVLNLKAKDIEVERINGQPVTNKTLVDALSQHESDISGLDTKIDSEVEALNDRIDGAIETFTGTVVPTLDNTPASQWNTVKLKDQHVGDVYYVVNSQSAQNGYCYRFTKSGSTYSWQLIKDSDVTAALSRLQTAEGKIGDIEQFDVTVGSFMTNTDDEISSLKAKDTQLQTSLGDKVSTSTFNTVSQKVDTNEANITSMSTVLTNNGLSSSTNITNTVNSVKQTADTNKASITSLTQTVNNKADGSTVQTIANNLSTLEQDVNGFKTTVSETYTTKTELGEAVDNRVDVDGEFLYRITGGGQDVPSGRATVQSVRGNTVVQDGSLLPVRMTGMETNGFNQWGEQWEDGYISDTTGGNVGSNAAYLRSKGYIHVFPNTEYHFTCTNGRPAGKVYYYDADKAYLSFNEVTFGGNNKTTPANARYMRFWLNYPGSYNHDICINISDPSRNGTYEPHWTSQRPIPASTYFPQGMRSAGSVYDELTENEAVVRVGEITFDGSNYVPWISSSDGTYTVFGFTTVNTGGSIISDRLATVIAMNELKQTPFGIRVDENNPNRVYFTLSANETTAAQAAAYLAQHPVAVHIALTTPTTTPIDPPLNMMYRAESGGTERIMVDTTLAAPQSAPVPMSIQYGINIYETAAEDALRTASIESRVTTAESSITQNAQNIELKVSKDGVISSINQSAETVKIQASKVEIDGTAVFNAISSDVEDAITSKGYQTSSQVNSAITSKGYQTSSQVNSAITSKGYQTSSQVESAITSKGYATTTQAQGYATTAKSEAISAAASDATSKANAAQTAATNAANEAYKKLRSQGIQLVTNGNGFMGDNTNWPLLTFDGSKSNGSPGSFTKDVGYATVMSAEMFPVDVSKEYLFEFDAISSDGNGRLYSFLDQYDVDGKSITAQYVLYFANTLTTLAKDLNIGDTTVTLTSASNWASTSYDYQRALIFWDYKNSYGYTYPTETYSRNYYDSLYTDDSKVNKSTGVITLKKAWAGPKKAKGTYVSQGRSGNSYVYAHTYVRVPTEWTHYSFVYSGLDLVKDGNDGIGTFRQGTAFAKAGFLWNYNYPTVSQGQIWVTNISVKEATASSSNAVKRTQRIWYRTNGSSAPATPGTASSNWVTKNDDGNDAWTKMHISINSTHKYIYTCEQYEMANGTVGYTSVLLDNTITVIDGGNIITGSVTANKLNAANINASKTLTIGAFQQSTQDAISNDKVPQYRIFTTTYSYTLSKWLEYAAEGRQDSWSQAKPVIVGDTVLIKGTASDTGEAVYLLATVDTVGASNQITKATSHGLIDPTAGQRADSIQIGSRNLLLWSGESDTYNAHSAIDRRWDFSEIYGTNVVNGNTVTFTKNSNGLTNNTSGIRVAAMLSDGRKATETNLASLSFGLDLKVGDMLTFSCDVKTSGNRVALHAQYFNGSGRWTDAGSITEYGAPVDTDWHRYSHTFTVASNYVSLTALGIYCELKEGVAISARNFKLERGNKATDWTPAPEDQTEYTDSITYQTSKPNLSPYFSSLPYNSDNPYWNSFQTGSGYTFTDMGDGWMRVQVTNSGTSTIRRDFFPIKSPTVEPGKDYTFLVEFRNNASSGTASGTDCYLVQTNNYQFWGGTIKKNLEGKSSSSTTNLISDFIPGTSGVYTKRFVKTSEEVGSSHWTSGDKANVIGLAVFTCRCAPNTTIDYELRISLYEGEYTGPYKPYSGDQLYATNMELASTNESLDGAIADIGELSDQLVDTTTEQNKTITTIQTYLNSLRQDLDAEIQSRQQWLNFDAAEGLVIGAKNSTFKTVTTNTSQQFKNGGTVLAETSGMEFVAPVMRSDQILIGNWMWTRRDNGNLSLKWIG